MNKVLGALGVIGTIGLVAVLVVLVYMGSWWVTRDSTNRTTDIRDRSFERQNSLVEGAERSIIEAEGLPDGPQRKAIITQACRSITRITNPPPNLVAFQAREC